MRALPRRATTLGLALTSLCVALACQDERAAAPPAATAGAAAGPETSSASTRLELQDGTGQTLLVLKAREAGRYRLEDGDGEKIGKVKVQPDRVKVKDGSDAMRAKMKKRDYGFKLLDGNEKVIFKGKLTEGNVLKLKNEAGEKVGKLRSSKGDLGGTRISVSMEGDKTVVRKDGQIAFQILGGFPAEPAALLAFPGLDIHQQAAILVFHRELW